MTVSLNLTSFSLSGIRAPKIRTQESVMGSIHCVFTFRVYYIVSAIWFLVQACVNSPRQHIKRGY